jgi:predicted Zn-dependent protease
MTWEFLGARSFIERDWATSAAAYREAVRLAPHMRLQVSWALALAGAGEMRQAARVYRTLIERDSANAIAWAGLAGAAAQGGDTLTYRAALSRMNALMQSPRKAMEIREFLRREPLAWPQASAALHAQPARTESPVGRRRR